MPSEGVDLDLAKCIGEHGLQRLLDVKDLTDLQMDVAERYQNL